MGRLRRLRLLLDTHVWLWSLLEPARVARRLARRLEDEANELWLSPISIWEALLLAERGQIEVGIDGEEWVRRALRAMPVRDATLTREVALASRSLSLPHEDPADRFIAASAIVYELTLVTSDQRLLDSNQYRTLANG
ncbi:MAG: type II toxin-antitoxin system VapC family toxin [Actinomycetota bacterium]|nr:type II toxin-antitoxin system VapC family toxin [Actinomycetota bacterium]